MRVLVSAVGTRGDVQPAVALATQLRAQGAQVRMCLPPNFVGWAANLGFQASPMGIAMRPPRPGDAPAAIPDLIADQFDVATSASDGCDLLVGCGVHQYAIRSVGELRGAPTVVAAYAPVSLPSDAHAPPGPIVGGGGDENLRLWDEERGRWNVRSLDRVNANRARLGLAPIADVLDHILGETPWLAADAALGAAAGGSVTQTGAWLLDDPPALPPAIETFLEAGTAPIYIGLGSMPVAADAGQPFIDAARAMGRRVILSRGWAGLAPSEDAADCLVVGDLNHQALFPRVAVAVHHGGAGTTTAAALAGAPQVIAPLFSDQFYWARRVEALGLGAAVLTPGSLTDALATALEPATAVVARAFAPHVARDGAAIAAARLLSLVG